MNWKMLLEPEVWVIIARIASNLFGIFVSVLGVGLMMLAFWNGYKVEIGKPDNGFYLMFEQYPFKRFFQ